jgi:pimeloyl-ACP methyl ester carboxylesterase
LQLFGSTFSVRAKATGILKTSRRRWRLNKLMRLSPWSILTAAQRQDIACLALKCPVVDFAEELRLEFGPDELARWQVTDTIPNLMGGPERIRLKYGLYEDSLQQVAYGPAAQIVAPTLIVQGACDELVPLHQSRRLLDALRGPKRLDLLPQADHQFTRGEDFRTMTTAMTDWLVRYLV